VGLPTLLFAHPTPAVLGLGMRDEIFQFEIFKIFMEILKYFKTPSLKYFMKFLFFIINSDLKLLKTWLKYMKLVGNTRGGQKVLSLTHLNER